MKGTLGNWFPIPAAAAFSAAWVAAWIAGLAVDAVSWPVRLAILSIGLVLAGISILLVIRRFHRDRLAVECYLTALCQYDPQDIESDAAAMTLPALDRKNPWRELARRVREGLAQHAWRVQELEQARHALEIRHRKSLQRCRRIEAILANLEEAIVAIDDYDEVVLANPSARRLFRLADEPWEERGVSSLIRCEKLVHLLLAISHRNAPSQRTEEIEIADDQGGSQWFRVTATHLLGPEEEPADDPCDARGAVAVLREIGGQKAAQKRNADFVSAVSHEMKTPLAGIKAYVELLMDGDAEDDQTRDEFLEVINSQTDRLKRLVDNLLNLARIEAGVVNVNKQSRSLNELLEEAIHVVQPAAEAKHVDLATDLSPMYLGVLADRDLLLQAAINLLSNAVKYTPQGGRVILRSRLVGGEAHFEVEDTGVGLSEEDCAKVFEKFYRVKRDKDMASGTGLGLPLARHIVEDVHGGRLTLRSALGVGSTFTVMLPGAGKLNYQPSASQKG